MRVQLGMALILAWFVTASAPAAVREPEGYWLGPSDAPMPDTLRGAVIVHARRLAAMLRKGDLIVIDVSNAERRPAGLADDDPWMPVAHRAVPGALWIPGVGNGEIAADLDGFFRRRLAQAAGDRLGTPVVLYCHRQCWLSWNAAKRVIGYGYSQVYWFSDGIEGWLAAGRPTEPALPQTAGSLPRLLVLDLELSGDLGGPQFEAEHAARLTAESARLREDLMRTGLYRLVDNRPAFDDIQRLKSQQRFLHDCNGCDLDLARELNADLVLVAWVDRVSGLILTLTYEIHDVASGQISARKSYDFRGDNDVAWNHAVDYMVRDIQSSAAAGSGT